MLALKPSGYCKDAVDPALLEVWERTENAKIQKAKKQPAPPLVVGKPPPRKRGRPRKYFDSLDEVPAIAKSAAPSQATLQEATPSVQLAVTPEPQPVVLPPDFFGPDVPIELPIEPDIPAVTPVETVRSNDKGSQEEPKKHYKSVKDTSLPWPGSKSKAKAAEKPSQGRPVNILPSKPYQKVFSQGSSPSITSQ